mgnify:CR=1 FL=1
MKQERHATTLAEDLQEASANTAEYGEFFTGLTGITDRKPVDDALGERIQGYVLGWLEGHPLTAFDDYSATAYRRTYLGRSPETGWEAIVMSWQEGNRTSQATTSPTAGSGSKSSSPQATARHVRCTAPRSKPRVHSSQSGSRDVSTTTYTASPA